MLSCMKIKPIQIGIAPCLIELNGTVPTEFKLTPSGQFKAKDGRPFGIPGWTVTEKNANQIIAAASNIQDQTLIDYEHQTLYTRENGKQAPAAGWFKSMEWRSDGLYALGVEWTEQAKQAIESKEYRYISPVLAYNKQSGEVTAVLMAALVNYPAIDGLTDLAAAHFNFNQTENFIMNKEQLALLGLDETATEEQINGALTALKAKSDKAASLETEITELKENPGNVDPSKFVPVETMTVLKNEVTALSKQISDKESGDLVAAALSDGQLLPAQKGWAESLDVEALKAYLKTAQPIAALKQMQTDGKQFDDQGKAILTDEQIAVCSQMGIEPEEYRKTLEEQK